MEESGRGAAVEQLTARGMDYQSPRWGAIAVYGLQSDKRSVSIPSMGGNRKQLDNGHAEECINPRNGGNSMNHL